MLLLLVSLQILSRDESIKETLVGTVLPGFSDCISHDKDILGMDDNVRQVENFLRILLSKQGPHELRAPRANGPKSRWYQAGDFRRMAEDICQANFVDNGRIPLQVYVTLNVVGTQPASGGCKDSDIAHRTWLYIDVDPIRPSGLNATDAEMERSREVIRNIRNYLTSLGYRTVAAASGNGFHLYLPLRRLANTKTTLRLVQNVLKGLGKMFNTEHAKVDPTMANASRITKCFGTLSVKEISPSADRPNRMTEILDGDIDCDSFVDTYGLDMEQLEWLSQTVNPEATTTAIETPTDQVATPITDPEMEQLANQSVSKFGGDWHWKEGSERKIELQVCPFDNETPRHSEYKAFIHRTGRGSVAVGCQHHHCRDLYTDPTTGIQNGTKMFCETISVEVPVSNQNSQERVLRETTKAAEQVQAEADAGEKWGVIRYADLKPEPLLWMWPNRFAYGMLGLVAGDPGLGKSLLMLDIACRISTGNFWPGSTQRAEQGHVLMVGEEDSKTITTLPRILAAGGDPNYIQHLPALRKGQYFNVARDMPLITNTCADIPGVRAVIVDPISEYLGKVDTNSNAEVRQAMAPLIQFAEENRICVIGLSHNAKSSDRNAIHKLMGSVAFNAVARQSHMVVRDPANLNRRLFSCVKNNVGPDNETLGYEAVKSERYPTVFHLKWDKEITYKFADEILEDAKQQRGRAATVGCDVEAMFAELFKTLDWISNDDLKEEAEKAGLKWNTVRDVAQKMQIKSTKRGDHWGRERPAEWSESSGRNGSSGR